MQRTILPQRYFSVPDVMILLLMATLIYGVVSIGNAWRAEFQPFTNIDLSLWALPRYTLLSAMRGTAAYIISLLFTLVIGYVAAHSRQAERVIIPALDILQSIPVLGFLPGLTLGLVALFPKSNTGLELAAVLLIFTGQVWNMTFSYYSSLKSIPNELKEAATVMALNWKQRLMKLELPFSAVNLAWNSLLSMAGGWFFLTVCESFKLGDRAFQLPGIGAYMQKAIDEGNARAMVAAVVAMITLIVGMDFFIWRPVLSWVRRFRLEEVAGAPPSEPMMSIVVRESHIVRWLRVEVRRVLFRRRAQAALEQAIQGKNSVLPIGSWTPVAKLRANWQTLARHRHIPKITRAGKGVVTAAALLGVGWGSWRLARTLIAIPLGIWVTVLRNTLWTSLRVATALALSSIWAVPAGIWVGTSAKRVRIAQPIIQVMASFPAPMLYPIALAVFFKIGISFDWGSMLLMMLGVQWYVLFNVLAGALRIPQELRYALNLMEAPRWECWKTLYLPSIFPALVTGWVTAAGGAWNASIVAEYLSYKGTILKTAGLGATIFVATETENFPLLAASLTIMIVVVVALNRTVWARVYALAQTRYRLDS